MLRDLFGGSITAIIPKNFVDVSYFRAVPDNQEVFVGTSTDQSIIVELLETVHEHTEESCIRFHFEQIAEQNEATNDVNRTILHVERLPNEQYPILTPNTEKYYLHGQQQVAKFNESSQSARSHVGIYLTCLRVPEINTDILITLNHPVVIGEESSSRQDNVVEGSTEEAKQVYNTLLESFEIKEWELFQ